MFLGIYKNLRITIKFVLWFLVIALIPMAISTYISYNSSKKVLRQEVTKNLHAVADNKISQIEAYLQEKIQNITTLSHTSEMIYAIEEHQKALELSGLDSSADVAVAQEFRAFLQYHKDLFELDNLMLVSSNGDLVCSIDEAMDQNKLYRVFSDDTSGLGGVFKNILRTSEHDTEVSNFELDRETQTAALYIGAPVFKRGEFIGTLIARMGNKGLQNFVRDPTGLGATGEAILASKIKRDIVFITPLRFDPGAAFKEKITEGSEKSPELQKAVKGERGEGIVIDRKGNKVLAVWRHLPRLRWGMMVKMNMDEVLISAIRLKNILYATSLVLLVTVVVLAVLIARSISRPIEDLTNISGIIASGDLSARATVSSTDEIGELAHSFNQMTESLLEAKTSVEAQRDQLEEQKLMLEKVNKELDSFTYTASHDLRAPLRGIASFATFLEEDYSDKLDDEARDHIKEIRGGAQRMSALIDDLLALSRISRIQNPFEDVDVNGLIEIVKKRIEVDIKEYRVDFCVAQNIPIVKCDRIKMTEVFLNLISNAIKFSSKNAQNNKGAPKVVVGYSDEGDLHKFFVKDNGIGIDPQYYDQIFGIFKRLHSSEEYEGTGAGLSIVKRVIDDHGGKVWVESQVGEGTTFCFTIPKDLKKKKKIGEILVEEGAISENQLAEGLKKQGGGDDVPGYQGEATNV